MDDMNREPAPHRAIPDATTPPAEGSAPGVATDPLLDEARFPRALLSAIGFEAVLARDTDAGSAQVAYVARADFAHSGGAVVQGGFVTAWLDNAMAFALHAKDAGVSAATLEIKVSFMGRASVARHVVHARVTHWGRSVAFMEAELFGEGRCLAKASSTVRLLR